MAEILAALPPGHPLRSAPLLAIGAQSRWLGSPPGKGWKPVLPNWRIAQLTFNDLGQAWTAHTEWRATTAPDERAAQPA